jgi:histidinol-phosphatase (PHP family)
MTAQSEFNLKQLLKRDLHCHTAFCGHATGAMEDYVEAALAAGLEELGFLEHVEAGIRYGRRSWLSPEDLDRYWEEGRALRAKYAGRIVVSVGIELGANPEAVDELQALAARHPWERIGLSCHFIPDEETGLHLNISSSKDPNLARLLARDPLEIHYRYYETLAAMIPVFRPAMVCHLDVVRRNLPDLGVHPQVRRRIRRVLEAMREAGTALEVNTAGYAFTGSLYPAPRILEEAVILGLPLVLNADAHDPAHVARFYDRAECELTAILSGS